jgi:alanine racemase
VGRRAVARVNLAAIERNCVRLRRELRDGTALCAVVKANGYGHGAAQAARAAQAGGATWLAVATADEAVELRAERIAGRILVMGALEPDELDAVVQADADVVAWRETFVATLGAVAEAAGTTARVHIKLDTGMGRLGTRSTEEADRVVTAVAAAEALELAGAMTHFATADEPGDGHFDDQLRRFTAWAQPLKAAHPGAVVHAANSAATVRDAGAHFDLVRCGIAVYGMDPFHEDPAGRELDPALELHSYVAELKPCAAGESVGYGRTWFAERDTTVAVLPLGYGDGVRRASGNRAEVLIAGRRHPVVGTVSMDNITVHAGDDPEFSRGEVATLIGTDGDERITAEDVARVLGTINYEITCGLSPRVTRVYHRDGEPA